MIKESKQHNYRDNPFLLLQEHVLYFLWSAVKRSVRQYPIIVIIKLWFQITLNETYLFIVQRPYLIPFFLSIVIIYSNSEQQGLQFTQMEILCFVSAIPNHYDRHHKSLASPFNLTSIKSFHEAFQFVWIVRLACSNATTNNAGVLRKWQGSNNWLPSYKQPDEKVTAHQILTERRQISL